MAINLSKELEKEEAKKSSSLKPEKEKKGWFNFIFHKKDKNKEKDNQKEVQNNNLDDKEDLALSEIKEESQNKKNKKEKTSKKKDDLDIKDKEGALDISLMPDKTVIIPRLVRSRLLILIAFLVVILTIFILIWFYTDWYFEKKEYQVARAEREIDFLEAKSRSFLKTRDQVTLLEERASRTEKILNNHVYWTKFFSLLEKYTLPDIYFGDFKANDSGQISLRAFGRDLMSIAHQIVVFSEAEDFVKEIETKGVAQGPDGITANFNLILVDDVFKK